MTLHDLTEGREAVGAVFFPLAQNNDRNLAFAVATNGNPEALAAPMRDIIRQLDRELPVSEMQSMDDRLDKSLMTRRSPMVLSLAFGAVALFLSAIGIYGVLAYLVAQRRKEIGIRLALGSSNGAIFELVLREGLMLIGAGLVLGALGALVLRKSLESQLFGVRASDPLVLATVTGVLAAVAIIAVAVPARRATKIDPIIALTE
jgi:putative ABC transport system permease protein